MSITNNLISIICILFAISANASADIKITNAYTKELPPNSPTTAVYFTITNNDEIFDKLIGASTPVAEITEIHEHVFSDGMMKMQKLESVVIAVGRTQFKPHGNHLMLINLKEELKSGNTFPITLQFANFGKLETTVTVK